MDNLSLNYKEILKKINSFHSLPEYKFICKCYCIILEEYDGNICDWYFDSISMMDNGNGPIYFFRVLDIGLIIVSISYNTYSNRFYHFKSFISFKNTSRILSEDKIYVSHSGSFYSNFSSRIDHILMSYNSDLNLNIEIDDFYDLFVRKFEEFCQHEYNKNQFSKADEIKKFKELLDEGTITQEEFELFKKDLLN